VALINNPDMAVKSMAVKSMADMDQNIASRDLAIEELLRAMVANTQDRILGTHSRATPADQEDTAAMGISRDTRMLSMTSTASLILRNMARITTRILSSNMAEVTLAKETATNTEEDTVLRDLAMVNLAITAVDPVGPEVPTCSHRLRSEVSLQAVEVLALLWAVQDMVLAPHTAATLEAAPVGPVVPRLHQHGSAP